MPTLGASVGPKVAPRVPKGSERGPRAFPGTPKNHSKIVPGTPSGKKGSPRGSRGAPGRENDTKIVEKTTHFDTEAMQKKASIPPCFSTVLGVKTGGTVQMTPQSDEKNNMFSFENILKMRAFRFVF